VKDDLSRSLFKLEGDKKLLTLVTLILYKEDGLP